MEEIYFRVSKLEKELTETKSSTSKLTRNSRSSERPKPVVINHNKKESEDIFKPITNITNCGSCRYKVLEKKIEKFKHSKRGKRYEGLFTNYIVEKMRSRVRNKNSRIRYSNYTQQLKYSNKIIYSNNFT